MLRYPVLLAAIVAQSLVGCPQSQVNSSESPIVIGASDLPSNNLIRSDGHSSPALRESLKPIGFWRQHRSDSIARVRSGNVATLQAVFCEVEEVAGIDPQVQQKLQRIGGGFAVLTLATLFDRDSDYERIVKNKKLWRPGQDYLLEYPSTIALRLLSEIVNKPPTTGPTFNRKEDQHKIEMWRKWIVSNREQIKDMQPNGDGVVFSNKACAKKASD
jgi:hypothetical protein